MTDLGLCEKTAELVELPLEIPFETLVAQHFDVVEQSEHEAPDAYVAADVEREQPCSVFLLRHVV